MTILTMAFRAQSGEHGFLLAFNVKIQLFKIIIIL